MNEVAKENAVDAAKVTVENEEENEQEAKPAWTDAAAEEQM